MRIVDHNVSKRMTFSSSVCFPIHASSLRLPVTIHEPRTWQGTTSLVLARSLRIAAAAAGIWFWLQEDVGGR